MPLNIDWRQILLHLFNFCILAIALYFLLYKPVKNFMAKRSARYEEEDACRECHVRLCVEYERHGAQKRGGKGRDDEYQIVVQPSLCELLLDEETEERGREYYSHGLEIAPEEVAECRVGYTRKYHDEHGVKPRLGAQLLIALLDLLQRELAVVCLPTQGREVGIAFELYGTCGYCDHAAECFAFGVGARHDYRLGEYRQIDLYVERCSYAPRVTHHTRCVHTRSHEVGGVAGDESHRCGQFGVCIVRCLHIVSRSFCAAASCLPTGRWRRRMWRVRSFMPQI